MRKSEIIVENLTLSLFFLFNTSILDTCYKYPQCTVFVLYVSDERTAGRGWGGVFLVFSFFKMCGFSFQIKINLY